MLRVFFSIAMFVVMLFTAPVPAMAAEQALKLTLSVTTRTQADGEDPVVDKGYVYLTLQPDGFILKDGSDKTVYAVKARRILNYKKADTVMVEQSLFAEPAFRENELKNRMGMAALVRKTKGPGHDYKFLYPGELEHKFAMTAGADTDVGIETGNNGASLVYNDELLGSFETGAWRVPEQLADSYRHMLIYAYPMHPRLRAEILAAPKGFKKLFLRHRPMDKKTQITDITVTRTQSVHPQNLLSVPGGTKVIYINAEKLQGPVATVREERDIRTSEDYKAHIDEALADEHYAEAMLAVFEHMVQFGNFPDGAVERILEKAPEKDWSRSLVKLIANPPGEGADIAEYTDSLQTVADYINAPNKYELNVHLAGLYLKQGDAQRAYDMLTGALEKNPYLTGAYVQLGDIFYNQFDMENAFACWEAAHKIAPDHDLVAKLPEFQDELEEKHPEFF